jgi:hypothetical protein
MLLERVRQCRIARFADGVHRSAAFRACPGTAGAASPGRACANYGAGAAKTSVRLAVLPEFVCTKNGTNVVPITSSP